MLLKCWKSFITGWANVVFSLGLHLRRFNSLSIYYKGDFRSSSNVVFRPNPLLCQAKRRMYVKFITISQAKNCYSEAEFTTANPEYAKTEFAENWIASSLFLNCWVHCFDHYSWSNKFHLIIFGVLESYNLVDDPIVFILLTICIGCWYMIGQNRNLVKFSFREILNLAKFSFQRLYTTVDPAKTYWLVIWW